MILKKQRNFRGKYTKYRKDCEMKDLLKRTINEDSKKILIASLGQLVETTLHRIGENTLVLKDKNDYLYQRAEHHVLLNESITVIDDLSGTKEESYYAFIKRNQLLVGRLVSRNFFVEGAPFFMEEVTEKKLYKKTNNMILISIESKLITNLLLCT